MYPPEVNSDDKATDVSQCFATRQLQRCITDGVVSRVQVDVFSQHSLDKML